MDNYHLKRIAELYSRLGKIIQETVGHPHSTENPLRVISEYEYTMSHFVEDIKPILEDAGMGKIMYPEEEE